MRHVGRNAPCPCGSGLKFKRCCLTAVAATALSYTSEDRDRALARLMRFSERPEFKQDHRLAFEAFWSARILNQADERLENLMTLEQVNMAYSSWFAFDVPLRADRTLLDIFLEQEGKRLRPGELKYLEGMRDSHLRLYEVLDVKADEGLELRDLFDDKSVWVQERLATRQLVRWDLLVARVGRGGDGVQVIEVAPYLFAAAEKEELVRGLRKASSEFLRECPGKGLVDFFRTMAPTFHQLWLDRVALSPPPKLVTGDGEPFVLARVTFDVLKRETLEAALEAHADMVSHDDGTYGWHEKAGAVQRGLGMFVLEGNRLVLETTSRKRAERGRDLIQGLAKDSVKFRAISYEDVGQAMKHANPARKEEARIPPEVEAEVLGKYYEDYYRKWLDQPIPALGNRTPRHAARLKTVRPKLIQVLKDLESRAERQRRQGATAYDFTWMWEELGIEPE